MYLHSDVKEQKQLILIEFFYFHTRFLIKLLWTIKIVQFFCSSTKNLLPEKN